MSDRVSHQEDEEAAPLAGQSVITANSGTPFLLLIPFNLFLHLNFK